MKLRSKLLLSLLLMTAAITAASLLIVRRSVRLHVREELEQSLENSAVTFLQVQKRRDDDALRAAELVASLPLLKAMMSTQDPATIQDASTAIWNTGGADLLALADGSGRLMAIHTADPSPALDQARFLFARSLNPMRQRDWWFFQGRLYQVFLRPVYAGSSEERNALGVLAMGYQVDPKLAQEVSRIASGQVAFARGHQILVSTLSPQQVAPLQSATLNGENKDIRLGGETFLAKVLQLSPEDDGPIRVVMLKSLDQATVFLSSLNRLIVFVGFAAVLLALVLTFLISHTFIRPLGELVVGVRALAKGDFSYPLASGGKDEVAEVTGAFDKMRQNLQESQHRMVNAARLEAVGQLAGGVAHDFNNLITIINGYTDLLMAKIKPDDPLVPYAQQIHRAGDRAASVTRQLLAFSRKQVVQPQLIDLASLVTNLTRMLKVMIGEDIEVSIHARPNLRKIFADPGQIEQVLLNLAVNARDAMPTGGKLIIESDNRDLDAASVSPYPGTAPGRYVAVSVTDTGCGMSPETRKQIFQPFFTTKETGKGTGLGLAIVSGIAKQINGIVEVDSELGKGSTFRLFLPEADGAVAGASQAKGAAAPRGSATILVVEDEEPLRDLVRESLRLRGYTVLEAANGREAIAVLEKNLAAIQLVITDVVMPQMGGPELSEHVRRRRPEIKVLLMTGYSDRIEEIQRSGVTLLPKPFVPEQLAKTVHELLSNAATSAAAPA